MFFIYQTSSLYEQQLLLHNRIRGCIESPKMPRLSRIMILPIDRVDNALKHRARARAPKQPLKGALGAFGYKVVIRKRFLAFQDFPCRPPYISLQGVCHCSSSFVDSRLACGFDTSREWLHYGY